MTFRVARWSAAPLCALLLTSSGACRRSESAQTPPPASAEVLRALEQERDALRTRLARARQADPRLAGAPQADVLVGVPVSFTARLVEQIAAGVIDQVELALRDIRIHKDDEVEAKTKLGTLRPGAYRLDLVLHEVRAVLAPRAPKVAFQGTRMTLALDVVLARGQGRGTLDFAWDSRGLGRLACEDFQVTQAVSGRVRSLTFPLRGAFDLSVQDGVLVAEPRLPDLQVHLNVEPSEETWKGVEQAIEARSWRCEKALGKVNVPRLLKAQLDKGFSVKLPRKLFKPIRLPAGLSQEVLLEGKTYALGLAPVELRLAGDMLWYGADVSASRQAPAQPAAASTKRP
jgi:hypothetical protein